MGSLPSWGRGSRTPSVTSIPPLRPSHTGPIASMLAPRTLAGTYNYDIQLIMVNVEVARFEITEDNLYAVTARHQN